MALLGLNKIDILILPKKKFFGSCIYLLAGYIIVDNIINTQRITKMMPGILYHKVTVT